MPHRFYVPDATTIGDLVTLPNEEAQHLTRVLRLGAGDEVRVFNGRGDEFESVVEASAKGTACVRLVGSIVPAPEARVQVTVAQAVLKGDKMDDVVRDAVMIGAAAIRPVVTTRTETSVAALEKGRRRARWERIAVSAAKQCGRAVVPPVFDPVPLPSLTQTLLDSWLMGPALMLVEPAAARDAVALRDLNIDPPTAATVLVGPEGGWTTEEVEALSVVCRLITMGERTLRADAMALVAVSALFARWGEL